jgi:ParB family chromosome partitioning protein
MGARMSDGRKKRLSMLDAMAQAPGQSGPAAPRASGSVNTANRALRGARDAVDGIRVWDLDPKQIVDDRVADRLDPGDVADLRDAIETNGQTVPILVRRDPADPERYLLVYGRRRLEAIRASKTVPKVRALIADLDDDAAVRAQISENMARRDLTFIEKALFARELMDQGFGTQRAIAEILTVTPSAISMAVAIVEGVGRDLATAIGPAPGIGRPRWEALAAAFETSGYDRGQMVEIADRAYAMVLAEGPEGADPSLAAFDAVMAALPSPDDGQAPSRAGKPSPSTRNRTRPLMIGDAPAGTLRRTSRGLRMDIEDGPLSDWLEAEADAVLTELHARFLRSARKSQ